MQKEDSSKMKSLEKQIAKLNIKLNELKEKHSDKIEEIKGTGLLNGIIFKSYLSKISSLINNIPINLIRDTKLIRIIPRIEMMAVSIDVRCMT